MRPLNEKQQKVFAFLKERVYDGVPPSVREIAAATGIKSTSTVHHCLRLLEDEGYITRSAGLNRAIRIDGDHVARVPIVGRVTAGMPILAVEEVEGYIPFSGAKAGQDLFALRIVGESMIGAGILDGDLVVAEKQCAVEPGDIVVALIDDEATVKRLAIEDGSPVLMPENPLFEPIRPAHAEFLGKVIANLRFYA